MTDTTGPDDDWNGADDIDALAGEYVLGTLDFDERAAVDARRRHETVLDAAIIGWERRLGPLSEAAREVAPPADLFERITERLNASAAPIVAAIDQSQRPSAEIITLKARVRRWQIGTLVGGLLAASLAAVIVLKPQTIAPDQTQYCRTPMPAGEGVALLIEADGGSRAALLVDAIQGQRQVVIKSLEANYRHVAGIAAATILGDGQVALILDVDAVVAASRTNAHSLTEPELALAG